MSSIYSQSERGSPTEQRIYTLSNINSQETISTTAVPPSHNTNVPRIRILLAPYMSPYVVPVHKVKTWEALHKTLASLFGTDMFNGRRVRITDAKGCTILPGVWKSLLEPNMTIIVDTCAYVPENSTIIFSPNLGLGKKASNPNFHSNHPSGSATDFVPGNHETEDACYEHANEISPLGHVGMAALMAPPNSLKKRPPPPPSPPSDEDLLENNKRFTSVSMFTGKRSDSRKYDHSITVKPLVIQKPKPESPRKKSITVQRGEWENTEKTKKSGWGKVARALLFVFSAGHANHNPHSPKRNQKGLQKEEFGKQQRWHMHSPQTPGTPPGVMIGRPATAGAWRPTTAHRQCAPQFSPPRRSANPHRRSRSLGNFSLPTAAQRAQPLPQLIHPTQPNPPMRRPSTKLKRSQSEKRIRGPQKTLTRSASLNHGSCVVSPPIPPRPIVGLGVSAQFVLAEEHDLEQLKELRDTLDGNSSLGTGSMSSRRGTASTQATTVDDFPLPKPPVKYSVFPPSTQPPSPVPHCELPPLPEADRRPPQTTPLIQARGFPAPPPLRKAVSADGWR